MAGRPPDHFADGCQAVPERLFDRGTLRRKGGELMQKRGAARLAAQEFFRVAPFGDVPQEADKKRRPAAPEGRDRKLDGKFLAAAAKRRGFDAPAQQRAFAARMEMCEPAIVAGAETFGNNQLRQLTA